MTSEIKVDTISEQTSANGVTIDGLTIKDGNIIGDVALAGTTPTFTVGDGGAEDAALIFDGNAVDYYIALDDSADNLIIGSGSTVGSNSLITIDSDGDFTLDSAGDIILDADGADVSFRDGGTGHLSISNSSNDAVITSLQSDKDMIFKGVDGGALITALTLDMSDAGTATFNSGVVLGDSLAGNGAPFTISNTNNGNNIDIKTTSSNSLVHAVKIHSGGVFEAKQGAVFNEDSNDVDFRVESNSNTNMLFVDGGNDSVHIGSATVESSDVLAVYSSGTSTPVRICNTNANSVAPSFIFQKNSSSPADSDEIGLLNFIGQDDNGGAEVYAQIVGIATDVSNGSEDGQIALGTKAAGTYAINMRVGNNILIGTTDNSPAESSSATGMRLGTNGGTQIATSGMEVMRMNRNSDDGAILVFSQAGSAEGNISVSGTTISYSGFTGTHWSRLADNSKPEILRGTIMDSIDEMCDWYQAVVDVPEVLWTADDNLIEGANVGDVKEKAYQFKESISLGDKSVGDSITFTKNETEYTGTIVKEGDVKHTKCKVSDTADSKKVYGIFSNWDDADDGLDGDVNDMYVAQVGTYIIRVHKDVTVAAGDLLVSNGDGTAKKQDDDIIRSKTVAKVNSNIKVETYSDGSYTVPCTLHC